MTDLNKIDFSKINPLKWKGRELVARPSVDGCIMIVGENGWIASRVENQWSFAGNQTVSFAALDELKAICAKVDAFIEEELMRIAEAEMPPWRGCTREEAQEYQFTAHYGGKDDWRPIGAISNGLVGTYEFRTRAPKPEAKVRPEFERLRGIIPNEAEVGILHSLLAHVAKPKPEPKMPTVRAPTGWRWERSQYPLDNPGWHLRSNHFGDNVLFRRVPHDKSERYALLACVAAYDEQSAETTIIVI